MTNYYYLIIFRSFFKKVDTRQVPISGPERAKKNVKEMQKNIKLVKKLPRAKGFSNILYPGERKNKTYKKNLNKDISIPAKILKEMDELNA